MLTKINKNYKLSFIGGKIMKLKQLVLLEMMCNVFNLNTLNSSTKI